MMKKIIGLGILLFSVLVTNAQVVTLNPDMDNSIYSESENSNGLGKLFAGRTCASDERRTLLHFEIAGMVPPGSTITDVVLTMNVDNVSDGAGSNTFSLYPVTTPWGEGTSFSGGGTGAGAIAPDATWIDAMFGTDPWATAGGDFIPVISGSAVLPVGTGDYSFTGAGMITDVQAWLADPSSNYGWILKTDDLGDCSGRRFGSKDDGVAPQLQITYTCDANPDAVCQTLTVYLNEAGEATIADADLDGGSTAMCGGELTFSASQTVFTCDDIFDGPVPPSMVITGVYDCNLTGGTPKGIELYVINDIEDLSIYGVGFANNGGGTDGIEFTFPAEPAAAGTYIYIASEGPKFLEFFGFDPTYIDSDAGINGDDAVELYLDDVVIDVFGEISVDGTGTPWDYMDGWAYRVSDTGLDGDVFNIANWTFSGINALDPALTNATAAVPIPIGTYTTPPTVGVAVTLTVMDETMHESTCPTAVMVFDTLAPAMSCVGSVTLVLDETGSLIIDETALDGGTTDGCGIASMSISKSEFTCADAGDNAVMLYATDIYGNMDSCEVTVTVDISNVLTITEGVINSPTCAGLLDGSIAIEVTGGTPDYTYDWDFDGTGDEDDLATQTELGAAVHTVIVKDAAGCQSTTEFTLTEPDPIVVTAVVTNESCSGAENGSVTLTIVGGTEPYDIVGATEDLAGGDYTLTVNDANGCSETVDFTIGIDTEIDLTITETPGISLSSNQDGATYQWISCPDFGPIAGATDQDFTPAVGDGTQFAVIVTIDGGCSDTSDCVTYDFGSVQEFEGLNVILYPNPSTGLVNIQLSNLNTSAIITVLDVKGSVVVQKSTSKENEIIDLSLVENGIYFVQIKTENTVITRKITVRK